MESIIIIIITRIHAVPTTRMIKLILIIIIILICSLIDPRACTARLEDARGRYYNDDDDDEKKRKISDARRFVFFFYSLLLARGVFFVFNPRALYSPVSHERAKSKSRK